MLNRKLSMGTTLTPEDESLWDAGTAEQEILPVESDPRRDPVYECCDTALWRKRLVLTPYMLLDRLQVCAEMAKEAEAGAQSAAQVAERMERIGAEVNHLLRLLERSGLWMDTVPEKKTACDGQVYGVVAEPFVAQA